MSQPRITNIRATLFLHKKAVADLCEEIKRKDMRRVNNFFMYEKKYIYTIFPNSTKVGVTKIRTIEELNTVKAHFSSTFNIDIDSIGETVRIDNVSASGQYNKCLNLAVIQQIVNKVYRKDAGKFLIQFDRNIRPEAICRTFSFGNITLFASGKFFIVGAKCQTDVKRLYENMLAIIIALPTQQ